MSSQAETSAKTGDDQARLLDAVNRIHRDLHRWQMSVTDVRKWKSVLLERQPDAIVETRMGSRSKLVEGVMKEFRPHTLIDYYFGLRTLVTVWALCGN